MPGKRKTSSSSRDEGHTQPAVLVIAGSFAAFLILALGGVVGNSMTSDEAPHLAAGWTCLRTGDFRLNPEHPPLLKVVAAAPLLAMDIWPEALRDDGSPAFRNLDQAWRAAPADMFAQWIFADRWFYALRTPTEPPTTQAVARGLYRNDQEAMLMAARLAILLTTGSVLAILIFLWSRALWGLWGAALSVALFCFDPNFIAHSGLVTTDSGIAALMLGAAFFLWRLTQHGTSWNVAGFALFFALAALAKFSAVLLVPIALALILISPRDRRPRMVLAVGLAMVITVVAIWAAYGFRFRASSNPMPMEDTVAEWSARKELVRRFPRGIPPEELQRMRPPRQIGWSGRSVLFAHRHRLLPEPYLYGFAYVQSHAVLRDSYLHGSFSQTGFSTYFFWTFLYKTPLTTIAAILVSAFAAMRGRGRDRLFLGIPVAIYVGVSVFSNLNIGHRHLLPVYPFLYILCGGLSRRWLAAAALSAFSCLVVFTPFQPMWGQHLAYFNELSGGPTRASALLLDSNLDWGQDMERLAEWTRDQDMNEPINLVSFGPSDPSYFGIRYLNIEGGFYGAPEVALVQARIPGWFAISANHYAGLPFVPSERDRYRRFLDGHNARLVARPGYAMLVFRIENPAQPAPRP